MSLLSLTMMSILLLRETFAFLHTQFHSSVVIDYYYYDDESNTNNVSGRRRMHPTTRINNTNSIRLNFNVTLYDVQCDFASVGEYSRRIIL